MTLTLPVLDAAMRILFLITGAEKAEVLQRVLEGNADPPYPAQLVQPRDGTRYFLLDEAVASKLVPDDESSTQRSGGTRGLT